MSNQPPAVRGVASATIEPRGAPADGRREHVLRLTLELNEADARRGDSAYVTRIAREALAAFGAEAAGCTFDELAAKRPGGKITAIEGVTVLSERPGDHAIEHLRTTLHAAGFNLSIRETRECARGGCLSTAIVGWNQPSTTPPGWYDGAVCGKHDLKRCEACRSTYAMSSSNTSAQAPSLHCEVCGAILIEWGGTKLWQAELVRRD
jgi:hypothetical protein